MTILGYDINGHPLRAGDRVVPADHDMRHWSGRQPAPPWTVSIISKRRENGVCFAEPDRDGDQWGAPCHAIRKLPPKQADNETTTWESIEQLTGWVPEGVRV